MPRIQLSGHFGAIVQVELRLPRDLKREQGILGVHSAAVQGDALIDTGSDVTAFDLRAARRAGLVKRDTGRLSTVLGHHAGRVPLLLGELQIADFGSFVIRGRGFHLAHLDYVAIIGRDILRHGVLVYNGKEGWATLFRDGSHTDGPPILDRRR